MGKLWKCEYCEKGFPCPSVLETHRRIHTRERPFTCSMCGQGFSWMDNLCAPAGLHRREAIHISHVREGVRAVIYTPDPPAGPHGGEAIHIPCVQEGLVGNVQQHERGHIGKMPFTCSECEKEFIDSSGLLTHQLVHIGDSPLPRSQRGKASPAPPTCGDTSEFMCHCRGIERTTAESH